MRKLTLAAIAALATVSTAALAAVNVDSGGNGFVGKGDVQLAFGWNNKAAQTNAESVVFAYVEREEYEVYCQQTVGPAKNPRTFYNSFDRKRKITSVVQYDARLKNQYTGYLLQGFSETTATGAPLACPTGWEIDDDYGADNYIQLVSTNGGELTVTFNGTTVSLPNTPVI